ncbi:hypothetical protein FNH09_16310 [Streptomyces adustus]|uniref:Pirin C-terminal domain-containing protein n=1 Tax=Streptomyces adustus TaxID=1609272 RepID=A0A5N8VC26_9ACTN|nr:hypothetical protein [Streptomyces adustus]
MSAAGEWDPVHTGQTAVFGSGSSLTVRADNKRNFNAPDLEILLLGGRLIHEPMAHYGPLVMNTCDELEQAFEDFQEGRLGTFSVVYTMSENGPGES